MKKRSFLLLSNPVLQTPSNIFLHAQTKETSASSYVNAALVCHIGKQMEEERLYSMYNTYAY